MENKFRFISPVNEYVSGLLLDKSPNTIDTYNKSINRFFSFCGVEKEEDIHQITSELCVQYLSNLKETLSKSSINSHLRPLKAFFNWMVEHEYLEKSPFSKIKFLKTPKKEATFLTDEEVDRVIAACTRLEDKTILTLMLMTGLRRDELVNLRMEDFRDCQIKVNWRAAKGEKERVIPLIPDVCDLLNQYLLARTKRKGDQYPWLFVSKGGFGKTRDGQFSGNAINQKFKNAMKRAGFDPQRISELSVHKLRHTFTANIIESSSVNIAQKLLGHSNLETTLRYAHLKDGALRNAILKQRNFLKGETQNP